jgi:hypothetical protein
MLEKTPRNTKQAARTGIMTPPMMFAEGSEIVCLGIFKMNTGRNLADKPAAVS